jgi:hypothetical protein
VSATSVMPMASAMKAAPCDACSADNYTFRRLQRQRASTAT